MPSSLSSAVVGRPVIASLATGSALAGCAALVSPSALVDPVACPGLLEGIAASIVRLAPATPVANVVIALNTATIGAATAALVWLALRLAIAPVPAVLTAAALAATLAGEPAYALSAAGAIAAGCLVIGYAVALAGTPAAATRSAWFGTTVGLALTAAMSPPLALPLGLVAAVVTWHARRQARPAGLLTAASVSAVIAALAVTGAGLLTAFVVAPLPGTPSPECLVLLSSDTSLAALGANIAAAAARVSPAIFVLAALGAATIRWRLTAAVQAGLIVAMSLGAASWLDPDPARTLALPLTGLWLLCASGLQAMWTRGTSRSIRLGVVAIGLVLVFLNLARATPAGSTADDLGHARVTRNDLAAIRVALPAGAVVVRDDVLTDVLWRSLPDTRNARFISADRLDVRDAFSAGPVFALPRATRILSRLGTRLEPAGRLAPAGLARVISSTQCAAIGPDTVAIVLESGAIGVTLVADEPDARGPVVLHLAAPQPLTLIRANWPRSAERGFFTSGANLDDDEARRQFEMDRVADGIPADWPPTGSFVARLEIWRVPGAPRALTTVVDGVVTAALARSVADRAEAIAVCPAFDATVEPLGAR